MLKASLQLRLGQSLTMTPQLQQAIRLLQLPSLELQAHIRELLETNVMLEADEDAEATGTFEALGAGPERAARGRRRPRPRKHRPASRSSRTPGPSSLAGPSDTPWNSEDDDRQQEYQDSAGQSLQEHLGMAARDRDASRRASAAIGRAIVDAINDDGYLTDALRRHRRDAAARDRGRAPRRSRPCSRIVQGLDPPGIGARDLGECLTLQLRVLAADTPGLTTALAIAEHHLDQLAHRETGDCCAAT